MNDLIAKLILESTGKPFLVSDSHAVSGGCINAAYSVTDGRRSFFIKTNQAQRLDMFVAEAEGLDALSQGDGPRVPRPIAYGANQSIACLILEFIPFSRATSGSFAALGEQLARQHQVHQNTFGWHRDNTIGATPQINTFANDWIEFLREQRFARQFKWAVENGYARELKDAGQQLMDSLDAFFVGYEPWPALLHGDLWSGNVATDQSGAPIIYDPAVYFGDREADIAMTEMFGRFDGAFYSAYENALPMDKGYARRKSLYNLYHLLNHLNMFGGSYLAQSVSVCKSLLKTL